MGRGTPVHTPRSPHPCVAALRPATPRGSVIAKPASPRSPRAGWSPRLEAACRAAREEGVLAARLWRMHSFELNVEASSGTRQRVYQLSTAHGWRELPAEMTGDIADAAQMSATRIDAALQTVAAQYDAGTYDRDAQEQQVQQVYRSSLEAEFERLKAKNALVFLADGQAMAVE